jgi:integrase
VEDPVAARKRKPRRTWGALRKLPSGRYQASYPGPDGARYVARQTFDTVAAADAWLAARRVEIAGEDWRAPTAPRPKRVTLDEYATGWLATRELKPRTRIEYNSLLERVILPDLGALGLPQIDPATVRAWHAKLGNSKPTQRAHAYGLLRTILGAAVDEELIAANPCRIRGANTVKRKRKIEPATLDQLATIAEHVPDRYQALILLAAWCGLRFGEITELRRSDVDLDRGVLRIRRGVVRTREGFIVGTPKSEAGIRDVNIPPHLVPIVKAHMETHVGRKPDALLFPAAGDPTEHLAPASLYRVFYPAREAAGRPDLRFHDLRHTGAVLAAATGATLAELMARLGHSTPTAAMRYQHAAADRDRAIAEALSRIATGSATGTDSR